MNLGRAAQSRSLQGRETKDKSGLELQEVLGLRQAAGGQSSDPEELSEVLAPWKLGALGACDPPRAGRQDWRPDSEHFCGPLARGHLPSAAVPCPRPPAPHLCGPDRQRPLSANVPGLPPRLQ